MAKPKKTPTHGIKAGDYVNALGSRFKVNRLVRSDKIEIMIHGRSGLSLRTLNVSDVTTGHDNGYSEHTSIGHFTRVGASASGKRVQRTFLRFRMPTRPESRP